MGRHFASTVDLADFYEIADLKDADKPELTQRLALLVMSRLCTWTGSCHKRCSVSRG